MAVLSTIANKNHKCSGDSSKTGKLGCQKEFGTPLHLLAFKKGTVIPQATDFNLAYINNLIKTNVAIPLVDASSFEDLSGEDTVSTNARGVERHNLDGLPKYSLRFEEGHEFYRELSKMTSFKAYDFAVGDDKGNWKFAIDSNGDYTGFKAGQVVAQMTTTKVQGGDPESKAVTVQFIDRNQWDRDYVIFDPTDLGFQPDDIQGVNGVTISFVNVPANGESQLFIKPVLNSDNDTLVTGTDSPDYVVTYDDVVQVILPGAVKDVAGGVTIDVPAMTAGEVVKVYFNDAATNGRNILSNGVLYCSNIAEVTVVA